jgi:hypothetical protein
VSVVSPIALRRRMRRLRRHAAGVAVLLAVAGAVVAHHSDVGMGAMHDDGMGMAVAVMCLGVFAAVGAAVVAVAIGLLALGRWRPPLLLAPLTTTAWFLAPEPRARAGPALLALLCVLRR